MHCRKKSFPIILIVALAVLFPLAPRASSASPCTGWQELHPEWIFCDDFEDGTAMVRQGRYADYDSAGNTFILADNAGRGGGKGMVATWAQGQVDAGYLHLAFGRNPAMGQGINSTQNYREIYYRVWMKTQSGWSGNPTKFSRATIFSASDWSQAMIAHVWGNNGNLLAIDPVRCTDTAGNAVCVGYNNFAHMTWLGAIDGKTAVYDSAHSNQWHCIESHVKLNDAGQSNGVQEFWIDGNLEARSSNLNFVASYSAYGINAVFLENYWNSGASQTEKRYLDNFVVSTERIGCSDNPLLPPTGLRIMGQ